MIRRTRIKSKISIPLLLALVSPTIGVAEEVGLILKQIKQEKASGVAAPKAPTFSVPNALQTSTAPARTYQSTPPRPRAAHLAPKPARPSVKIWRPKDKLPKNVVGHGVAGRFAVEGHYEGRVCLVPLEDRANPFARHFVVVNRSLNLPDFHVLPVPEREIVEISEDRPLIFENRGIMGYYYVRALD